MKYNIGDLVRYEETRYYNNIKGIGVITKIVKYGYGPGHLVSGGIT